MIPPLKLDHLKRMTDSFGLFQFASGISPNSNYGYTLDDNARALILCSWLIKKTNTHEVESLIAIYFNFLKKCLQKNGSFINYIGSDMLPTDQNNKENLEDVQSRALWALCEVVSNKDLPIHMRDEAKKIFLIALPNSLKFTYLRSKAFAIKSFAIASRALPERREELLRYIKIYADSLLQALKQHSDTSWTWFEDGLSYSNALLSEALLIAAECTHTVEYKKNGLLSLSFLIQNTFSENIYRPIGNAPWYIKGQKRSYYDQQPEDPTSMIFALIHAYKFSQDKKYIDLVMQCFNWFLGNNSLGIPLYDSNSGGCHDGLLPDRVNKDQGAESLISYLLARVYIERELFSK